MSEAIVRSALRVHALAGIAGACAAIDEVWVPRSNERADIAVIGRRMDGFEIKTDRDTLRRLPRQVDAYGRLFDHCTAVIDERHRRKAEVILPEWWGITTVAVTDVVTFTIVRNASANPSVDPEILVRLLWRDEALKALVAIGCTPDVRTTRSRLWADLLRFASLTQLRAVVRDALLNRTADQAKIPTRRFGTKPAVLPAAL
jgi:hypothetical protein